MSHFKQLSEDENTGVTHLIKMEQLQIKIFRKARFMYEKCVCACVFT